MNPKGLLPAPVPYGVGAPNRGAAGGLSLGPLEIAGLGQPQKGQEPPNLQTATEDGLSCGSCEHFAEGGCVKFEFPVAADQVCDAWEEMGAQEPEGAMPPMPAMAGGMPGGMPPGMEG